ncbi:universal stress protein [Rhodococcus sp. 06-1460-1B]|uniref:universal stress protein n=1 Tax=Rhodococcus sp. 06-1460-1B TaxID=2022501 RepID=UPI00113FD3EA
MHRSSGVGSSGTRGFGPVARCRSPRIRHDGPHRSPGRSKVLTIWDVIPWVARSTWDAMGLRTDESARSGRKSCRTFAHRRSEWTPWFWPIVSESSSEWTVRRAGGVALPYFVDWPAYEREEAALLSESLAGWAEKYPDVQINHELRQGNTSHTLVDLSAQSQLVIVGSHGRGSIASLVLGSTGANLVHHAHRPVMICRDGR